MRVPETPNCETMSYYYENIYRYHIEDQYSTKFSERDLTYLRVMEAGNTNASKPPRVAPEISKATHMLGMNIAPTREINTRPILSNTNLFLSKVRGLAVGKRRPSKLSRRGKNMVGKTSMTCAA